MPEASRIGPLLAQGRAADVYDYGDGLVLRRYRTPHDCLYEAAVMQHVVAHGYPAPAVVEVQGSDIVMERVDGRTMLDDFSRRPWLIRRHARTLADLIRRLHVIPPPEWLVDKLGGGDTVVHLDLHPDNVILAKNGPVVIDWTNAGRGDPNAELADLWVLFKAAQPPTSRIKRTLIGLGRGYFVETFISQFDKNAIRPYLRSAAEHRARDRNMLEPEKLRMRRFAGREARD